MTRQHKCTLSGIAASAFCACVFVCTPSWADEPSAADRETARSLLIEGRKKFDRQEFEGALKDFEAAHGIMKVPTTGLDLARAQEAMGLLIEARTTALEVTLMPPKPNEHEAFAKARSAAKDLEDKIAQRIPSLVITINGRSSTEALRVAVDGLQVPNAGLGLPRKVNAGPHTIRISEPGQAPVQREVTLKERETLPVVFDLPPLNSTIPGEAAGPDAKDRRAAGPAERNVPVWAWATLGVGLASLGTGIGFAVDFADAKNTTDADCPDNKCLSTYTTDDIESLRGRWNRSLALTTVFGAAGVGCVVASLVGIISTKRSDEPKVVITPQISLGAAGAVVAGSF
jgi:hypothetical protein